ncbi:hypothetical protein GGR54DRAFT_448584 [Hypoxylon sp. NC1633]|nr:hypothetical protein GGR54DRAFT_448584 [Hypoxylon sp. NC1633]
MSDKDIIGIIQVQLDAFTFQPNVGREKDKAIVKRLVSRFGTAPCEPEEWDHHVKGYVGPETYNKILSALGMSEDEFRRIVQARRYPRLRGLRRSILCLDGRQRLAAAREKFGNKFWWTVRLYSSARARRFSHRTTDADGEIYWNVRRHDQRNESDVVRDLYFELSPGKERILKFLLKEMPGQVPGQVVFVHQDIVDALDRVFAFPGMRKQFRLGTMLKVLALHCPEQVSHYGRRRIADIWWKISDGHPSYVDHETVVGLQRRVPSNRTDRTYIRTMMDSGQIFRHVKDRSLRERIKRNILSLNIVIPSIETFHENMMYFSIGAKILRKFEVDDEPNDSQVNGGETLFQNLDRHWQAPDIPRIEVGALRHSGERRARSRPCGIASSRRRILHRRRGPIFTAY